MASLDSKYQKDVQRLL